MQGLSTLLLDGQMDGCSSLSEAAACVLPVSGSLASDGSLQSTSADAGVAVGGRG